MQRVRLREQDQSEQRNSNDIDFEEAERFLSALDPDATSWSFQTFDDIKERRDTTLTCVRHGSFSDHAKELARLNRRGAGIYVAVNETDARGRKKENIKRVRALVLDLDGAPIEPVYDCGLKPHIVVETSPGKYHTYWLVDGLPVDEYKEIMFGVAQQYDGDPGVAMSTLVVRVPGFFHRKAKPFRSKIVKLRSRPRYTAGQINKEFPREDSPHKPPASRALLFAESPVKSAQEFVEREFLPPGRAFEPPFGLQHFGGSYYRWTGPQYEQVEKELILKHLYKFLDAAVTYKNKKYVPFNPTPSKVNQIEHALQHGVLLKSKESPPFWIKGNEQRKATDIIASKNGLVDIGTLELRPHIPAFFNTISLPFEFDPNAPKPKRWLKFLEEIWPDDEEAERTLQEIFGLLLTTRTEHQKIFAIIGPKRSGKGTIARVLTALLGRDNVVYPNVDTLGKQFGPQALIDKSVAIISDARQGQGDTSVLAERLLAISGEDDQLIDRKYRSHWSGRLTIRFLLLSNQLPRINDAAGALASRFVLLTIKETFYGKEDQNLTHRLLQELPGILNWSLVGLKRLNKRGYFIQPRSSMESIALLEDLSSPTSAFIRDWCVMGPTERVNVKLLYDAWVAWCQSEGHKPGSRINFGRYLRACIPTITTGGTGAKRYYVGIDLSMQGKDQYESLNFKDRT